MIKWKAIFLFSASIALANGQVAQAAENAIYQGDCTRAWQVKEGNPITSLLKYAQYRGASLTRFPGDVNKACKTDTISILYLSQKTIDGEIAKFNVQRKYVTVGSKVESCNELAIQNETIIGTVKFFVDVKESGELCSVNLWADFALTDTANADWKGEFASRAVVLENGSFVIGQSGPTGGSFRTPIAFTGL